MFWVQFSSVAQSCPTLCNSMDCSTPGLPVHQLLEFTQTHAHWVGDAIQPSHPLNSWTWPVQHLLQRFSASRSLQYKENNVPLKEQADSFFLVVATISLFQKKTDELKDRKVCLRFLTLRHACWNLSSILNLGAFKCCCVDGSFRIAPDAGATVYRLSIWIKQACYLLQTK